MFYIGEVSIQTDILHMCTLTELKVVYSTDNEIFQMHIGPEGLVQQHQALIPEWPEIIYFQDMDWKRGFLYWTDDKGELMRYNIATKTKLIIPTNLPGEALAIGISKI